MKSISLLGVLFLGFGCQAAIFGTKPVPYQGTKKTLVLAEPYVWAAGLANVRHEFASGIYVAKFQESNGLYYVQDGNPTGIYVANDRSVVYGFSMKTKEEEAQAAQILRPGTMLVAKGIGLEPGVGKVDAQIVVRGDWRKAFVFND